MNTLDWCRQSLSYRLGFVEGQAGERNKYLLESSAKDIDEYNRGFADGLKMREAEQPTGEIK